MLNIVHIHGYVDREEDPYVSARVFAHRKNGSIVTAGDRFLRSAVITLFSLLIGEQLLPRQIRSLIKKERIKVDENILDVL